MAEWIWSVHHHLPILLYSTFRIWGYIPNFRISYICGNSFKQDFPNWQSWISFSPSIVYLGIYNISELDIILHWHTSYIDDCLNSDFYNVNWFLYHLIFKIWYNKVVYTSGIACCSSNLSSLFVLIYFFSPSCT